MDRTLRVLHTSDLHLGLRYGFPGGQDAPFSALAALVEAAAHHRADAVVIAGDLFDSNRVEQAVVARAAELFRRIACPVVVLPGNHDPYTADSVYCRGADLLPPNLRVLHEPEGELLCLANGRMQVWGRAHAAYESFRPLAAAPRWHEGGVRIAVAHGHFVADTYDRRFSYPIEADEIERLGADYVALGHWDVFSRIGHDGTNACYSGSPCRTGSFVLVTAGEAGIDVRCTGAALTNNSAHDSAAQT